MDFPDLPDVSWADCERLTGLGVPPKVIASRLPIYKAVGGVAADGYFDLGRHGTEFFAFVELEDFVFWNPSTDQVATWAGRAFALGEDNIINAATYSFDQRLRIHASPLGWLQDRCRGIVVLDWSLAFDMLRDAPAVTVDDTLLDQYRRHMSPRLPDVAVATSARLAA